LPQRGQTPVSRVSASSIGLTRPAVAEVGGAAEVVVDEVVGGAIEPVAGWLAGR
jgi:hypothetical protein